MFDLIVIGGGPAGVTAALRGRELGASVALVERGRLGGTCTNDGCVPTRVLAKAARLARDAEQYATYGLIAEKPSVDFEALIKRTQQVVYSIHEKKQLIHHLNTSGVVVYAEKGSARFRDAHTLAVGSEIELRADKFIIAAGGRPRKLSFPGAELALSHSDVWSMNKLPESVAIVGAAATGCQLATIFAAFGVNVSLLDVAPRILPGEDEHVSQSMRHAFEHRKINAYTSIGGVEKIEAVDGKRCLTFTAGGEEQKLTAEAVILSVGWPGNLQDLNLPAAGVDTLGGYIRVDDDLRTTASHIYAAGDITGRMMLVQSASYEARIAVENAITATRNAQIHNIVPHGGFTDPEYGSVGMTESQARARYDCAVTLVPYHELDRAVIDHRLEGFCKLIVGRQSRRVLGVHVVGEQALEIVQLVAAGMTAGMTVEDLAGLELAYPTYAAIVGLAARRLAYELGVGGSTVAWRALSKGNLAEWERLTK